MVHELGACQPVHELIGESRPQIERLVATLAGQHDEPLVDAYLACLEAASSIGRALDQSTQDIRVDAVREALHASRAASMAIRFSLFGLADRERAS